MLGLSRHVYSLATNRQIPAPVLGRRDTTPHVAIAIAAVMAFGLVIPGDIEFLAGVYAFGALLAISIAHLSVIRLRVIDLGSRAALPIATDRARCAARAARPGGRRGSDYGARVGERDRVPRRALYLGGGWMVFGLVGYVVYRRVFEGTSLTKRVSVPAKALTKEPPEVEYGSILVPMFGTELDDDIVDGGTPCRRAGLTGTVSVPGST